MTTWETIHRKLMSVAANAYDEDALEFICDMNEKQRQAAVVILKDVEESIIKFKARLQDLASSTRAITLRSLTSSSRTTSTVSTIGLSTPRRGASRR
ncbi:hypothetical protein CQ14_09790 [Bradyrhizobium lablabi]|uniref:Uncharacterized protein n=1 Tax=Bradyrhizobium lablabi TaxID=722472 RepID=A0A0R3N7I8_9BRAD|nr:hypothetical protein CQ14_09790 [Bradyrhizobium lablabi]